MASERTRATDKWTRGLLRIAGMNRRCKSADVLFLPRDTVHEERHDSDGRHFMIDVAPANRARLPRTLVDQPRVMDSPNARRVMRRLRAEFLQRERSTLVLEGLALLLLAELEGVIERAAGASMPSFVRQAEEFVRASFTSGISLDDVAAAVGVDARRLSVAFSRGTGRTVGDLVRELQVDLVCGLLETTEEPIASVAQSAGFCDHSHCCRVFKQALGESPRAFRERAHRAKANPPKRLS